ncbi:MAG: AraC family transcriptional regulator [Bryobacteraceae bacterium]
MKRPFLSRTSALNPSNQLRTPHIEYNRPMGFDGIELHAGTAVRRTVPRHWHEEYHLCAHIGGGGALNYRGTTHMNGVGSVNLVEPGEVHSNHTDHPEGCDYLALNFDPALFHLGIDEMVSGGEAPGFSAPVTYDRDTFVRFVRLHRSLTESADLVEQQVLFLDLLTTLLERHARRPSALKPVKRETRAVELVRDYLSAHYARKVDLASLALLTGLSPFHLTRVFAAHTGLPPHAFLKQVRIARAMTLLRKKVAISHVALETGFADQSHLTRAFKRIVGVSPGAYSRLAFGG